eukprot:TRINITY_DN3052_c0_g1_i4.p3 TRINITY_DN3052_c0_g1~~TRINITY_DN3052_c0_g1_i4.p3  ORF type:complete len:112 (-),score=13.10 TRINITY_DN3052_c0_g1_i4:245-580(-)
MDAPRFKEIQRMLGQVHNPCTFFHGLETRGPSGNADSVPQLLSHLHGYTNLVQKQIHSKHGNWEDLFAVYEETAHNRQAAHTAKATVTLDAFVGESRAACKVFKWIECGHE